MIAKSGGFNLMMTVTVLAMFISMPACIFGNKKISKNEPSRSERHGLFGRPRIGEKINTHVSFRKGHRCVEVHKRQGDREQG